MTTLPRRWVIGKILPIDRRGWRYLIGRVCPCPDVGAAIAKQDYFKAAMPDAIVHRRRDVVLIYWRYTQVRKKK